MTGGHFCSSSSEPAILEWSRDFLEIGQSGHLFPFDFRPDLRDGNGSNVFFYASSPRRCSVLPLDSR